MSDEAMELVKAHDLQNKAQRIQQFLEGTRNVQLSPDDRSLTARLSYLTLRVLRQIVRGISKYDAFPKEIFISLERSYGRFKLWSDGYGVSEGNLDESLEKSRNLRHVVLRLIRRIGTTVSERLIPQLEAYPIDWKNEASIDDISRIELLNESAGGDHDDDSCSDDSSVFEDDTLDEITEDLRNDTMCLTDLDPLIQGPVLDSDTEKSGWGTESALNQWVPHQVYCDMIQNRFPSADSALVVRLGKANYERYIRCQEQRDTCKVEYPESEPADQLPVEGTVVGSKFHDSGIGSLASASSSYAETVMSYGDGNAHRTRIPPLPKEGREGLPFECTACGEMVRIANNSVWKRHLFQDLCPWLCLDDTCSSGNRVYTTRQDWVDHLALGHSMAPDWDLRPCDLCHELIGPGKVAITKHLGAHLEEISLGSLPINVEFDDEKGTGLGSGDGFSVASHDTSDVTDTHSIISVKEEENKTELSRTEQSHPNIVTMLKKADGPPVARLAKSYAASDQASQDGSDQDYKNSEYSDQYISPTMQASSYWSVAEAENFPQLLSSFGSDWAGIAAHMRNKTAVMVKNYYTRHVDGQDWKALVAEAEGKKDRGDMLPIPPPQPQPVFHRYTTSQLGHGSHSKYAHSTWNQWRFQLGDRRSGPGYGTDAPRMNTRHEQHYIEGSGTRLTPSPRPADDIASASDIEKIKKEAYLAGRVDERVKKEAYLAGRVDERVNNRFIDETDLDGLPKYAPTLRILPTDVSEYLSPGYSYDKNRPGSEDQAPVPPVASNNAAPRPITVFPDVNGVRWITFEYTRDRVKMEYTIRCDIESVDVGKLSSEFKSENCVYPRACVPMDQYRGNRIHYETECNTVGWALAELNPSLREKRGLIQRAVDSWRNCNQDPRLRSRRVRRMAKMDNRKAVESPGPQDPSGPAGLDVYRKGSHDPRSEASTGGL